MTKIFISHSTKDTEFARQIAQALIGVGISVWIDVADIPAGMKWSTAIQQGLNECDAMILVISPDSMASDNVEDEWQDYRDRSKKLFPVLWRPTEFHFQLRRLQYIDFHGQNFAAAFVKLCAELQRQGFAVDGSRGQMTVVRSDNAPSKLMRPSFKGILPDPFEWCEIPAGKVTLIEENYDGSYIELGEQKTFDVPAFAIAKYPITNAQYEVFITAKDGYSNLAWWGYSPDAKQWRVQNQQPAKTSFSGGDLPRTDVAWYEAVAFCRWLSARVDALDTTSITLPTEQQWQRAAQSDDGRVYPWGNKFDPSKANTYESGLDKPTSVTQYPHGASPYGVLDMSSNVSEWCLTGWDSGLQDVNGTEARSVRGGSFRSDQHDLTLTVSYRGSCFNPGLMDDDLGFRLVVSSAI